MERIGVFHREFAHADEPGARAGFIAEFGLDLINHERVFRIALAVFPHELHGSLFMGHAEHEWGMAPVLKAYELAADAFIPA